MKCNEMIQILNRLAPFEYAEDWDNVGLLVGDREAEIHSIMLALDPTEDVIRQAIEQSVDLLLTHHPLILHGEKQIVAEESMGRRIRLLIENGIQTIAMHTNYDAAHMAKDAAEMLHLQVEEVLQPIAGNTAVGCGIIGHFSGDDTTMTVRELAQFIRDVFGLPSVRIYGNPEERVERTALLPGSGADEIELARRSGANVYITGDIKHHTGLDSAQEHLNVIDAGHWGLEHIFAEKMEHLLRQELRSMELEDDVTICEAHESMPYTEL